MIRNEIKVKDLQYNGKGIMEFINEVTPFKFSHLEGVNLKDLDRFFYMRYGSRSIPKNILEYVSYPIKEEDMNLLASFIIVKFMNKWDDLYKIYESELELGDYKMVTEETVLDDGITKGQHTTNYNQSDTEKVTGYNDDMFTDDSQRLKDDTTEGSSEETEKNTRTLTRTISGYRGDRTKVLLNSLKYLQNNLIFDIIYTDIARTISILVY